MAEEVINYSGYDESSWFRNKWRGLKNRYFKYKRYLLWDIHWRTKNITLDYSKISSGSIPVMINNFNRLDLLKKQIDWLISSKNDLSIIIVDNKSTYPPLLAYYKSLNHPSIQVVYLDFNSWRKGVEYIGKKRLQQFDKFIITDSDLLPYENTPDDLIEKLAYCLDKYPTYNHVGPSLEIEDIPDHNPLKQTIIKYESEFWEKSLNEEVYPSKIDTTFAMYRKGSSILATEPALRTMRPYTLKHMDWYLNPKNHTDEFIYYLKSCKSFATWAHESKREKKEEAIEAN